MDRAQLAVAYVDACGRGERFKLDWNKHAHAEILEFWLFASRWGRWTRTSYKDTVWS